MFWSRLRFSMACVRLTRTNLFIGLGANSYAQAVHPSKSWQYNLSSTVRAGTDSFGRGE